MKFGDKSIEQYGHYVYDIPNYYRINANFILGMPIGKES
jgi:hypothetical protein